MSGEDGLARPAWAAVDPLLRDYYDTEWGMPIRDEQGLFERISLEAFQSGLSWATILRKRPAFRTAFDDFAPDRIAQYGESDVARRRAGAGQFWARTRKTRFASRGGRRWPARPART